MEQQLSGGYSLPRPDPSTMERALETTRREVLWSLPCKVRIGLSESLACQVIGKHVSSVHTVIPSKRLMQRDTDTPEHPQNNQKHWQMLQGKQVTFPEHLPRH